ncbi:Lysine--tRNA ligase [Thelohanellus kitauei]|uniref:Lysine--tRNA ligase n=1 Tax=Thelohanellus kitauei TaxID=669202 RepID=A0A0C2IY00_THEKT|nr:Lysine--tRNA ligase [Thelohanellus kitauei]
MAQKGEQAPKSTEELSPGQYYEHRFNAVQNLKITGPEPYPHKFCVTTDIQTVIEKYGHITAGNWSEDEVSIGGRVYSKRNQGKNLVFYDVFSNGSKIQIMARFDDSKQPQFHELHELIHRGDIVGFKGHPGRTKKGEISIKISESKILSPCMFMLPHAHYGLKDRETRYRKRYLDLIMNDNVRQIFVTRSKIIKYIRSFLDERDFLEVETSILNLSFGGANAKPFQTFHNQLNLNMFLRIATELPLKQLIIGGIPRVYEIGRQFRNEGIDLTHNPEFTTCEFYMAFADYNDLMEMTEQLLSGLVHSLFKSYKVTFHPNQTESSKGEPVEIDFTPPYRRIVLMDELEKALNVSFPPFGDFSDETTRKYFDDLCVQHNVECPEPRTVSRLLDKLVGQFLESQIVNPAFIIDHPQIMCPLAKWHRSKPNFAERFELFVLGRELVNAYTELNDPKVQRELFIQQAKDSAAGDEEAQPPDEDYCVAMEYGMPPVAGWGLGIERLTMFLTDSSSIKEVIFFPTMKPDDIKDKIEQINLNNK